MKIKSFNVVAAQTLRKEKMKMLNKIQIEFQFE